MTMVTIFINILFTDEILIHFFIKGFNNKSIIRKILKGQLAILTDAKNF